MEIDVTLHSPFLIVPENGRLSQSSTVLLVDLGSLQVTSAPQQLDSVRVSHSDTDSVRMSHNDTDRVRNSHTDTDSVRIVIMTLIVSE